MSYNTLQRIIRRPKEKYYLLEAKTYQKGNNIIKDEVGNIIRKDDIGNVLDEWVLVQELHGVIQHRQDDIVGLQGQESLLRYHGIFTPDFTLDTNKLTNYRVKFVREHETLYLGIIEYDPNNFLRDKQSHITLIMDEDKKYYGRQK